MLCYHMFIYMIVYVAVGCPDIPPPKDAWITQEGNKVTVGCHGSHDRWVLICNNSVWQGRYGHCISGMVICYDVTFITMRLIKFDLILNIYCS